MNATTEQFKDISYCVVSSDTLDIAKKIREWIAARQSEGWTVDFSIRSDWTQAGETVGVMWQCIKHVDGHWQEFTPCISMAGREFMMN